MKLSAKRTRVRFSIFDIIFSWPPRFFSSSSLDYDRSGWITLAFMSEIISREISVKNLYKIIIKYFWNQSILSQYSRVWTKNIFRRKFWFLFPCFFHDNSITFMSRIRGTGNLDIYRFPISRLQKKIMMTDRQWQKFCFSLLGEENILIKTMTPEVSLCHNPSLATSFLIFANNLDS